MIDTNKEKSIHTSNVEKGKLNKSKMSVRNLKDKHASWMEKEQYLAQLDVDENFVKVHIHTLTGFTSYGAGDYVMTGVKTTECSDRFLTLPYEKIKCSREIFEDCDQEVYTKDKEEKCDCVNYGKQHLFNIVSFFIV